MKKLVTVCAAVAAIVVLAGSPAHAFKCPTMIKEGKEAAAKMKADDYAEATLSKRVTMSDGVSLQATVTGEAPLITRPLIVEFSPYAPSCCGNDFGPDYNDVQVHARGTGLSTGVWGAVTAWGGASRSSKQSCVRLDATLCITLPRSTASLSVWPVRRSLICSLYWRKPVVSMVYASRLSLSLVMNAPIISFSALVASASSASNSRPE